VTSIAEPDGLDHASVAQVQLLNLHYTPWFPSREPDSTGNGSRGECECGNPSVHRVQVGARPEHGREPRSVEDVCRIRSRFSATHRTDFVTKLLASVESQARVYWRFRKDRPAMVTCHSNELFNAAALTFMLAVFSAQASSALPDNRPLFMAVGLLAVF